MRTLAITGANGYIGEALCKRAVAQGWKVVALSRNAPDIIGITHIPYQLDASVPDLTGVDAVVHLAAILRHPSDQTVAIERKAASNLQAKNAAFIYISSQAARVDAPTIYGRGKWLIEQDVLAKSGLVVRPGMVYGGREKGLFGSLCKLLRRAFLLPDFRPRLYVQPIHVDDLCEGILLLASQKLRTGIMSLASPEAIGFTDFLRAIAYTRLKRPVFFFPFPLGILLLLEKVVKATLRKETPLSRLASIAELPRMDTADDLKSLGLELRSLSAGMQNKSVSKRPLLLEAKALLHYVLREAPAGSLMRRYVRAKMALQPNAETFIAPWMVKHPAGVGLLDSRNELVAHSLNIASWIAEASPQGAKRFLMTQDQNPMLVIMQISWAVCCDIFVRVARCIYRLWERV